MYNFKTLIRNQYSENHLEEKDNIDTFFVGNYNPKEPLKSEIPTELRTLGETKLEAMKKGEIITVTEVTTKTFILEKE